MTRITAAGIALFVCSLPQGAGAEWSAPERHPIERYQHIWLNPPFVVASDVTPKSESLADRFALTGAARIGENDIVFVLDRRTMKRFAISGGQSENDVELLSLNSSDNARHLSAIIRSRGETAEIRYASDLPAMAQIAQDGEQRRPAPDQAQIPGAAQPAPQPTGPTAEGAVTAETEPPQPQRVIPRRRVIVRP